MSDQFFGAFPYLNPAIDAVKHWYGSGGLAGMLGEEPWLTKVQRYAHGGDMSQNTMDAIFGGFAGPAMVKGVRSLPLSTLRAGTKAARRMARTPTYHGTSESSADLIRQEGFTQGSSHELKLSGTSLSRDPHVSMSFAGDNPHGLLRVTRPVGDQPINLSPADYLASNPNELVGLGRPYNKPQSYFNEAETFYPSDVRKNLTAEPVPIKEAHELYRGDAAASMARVRMSSASTGSEFLRETYKFMAARPGKAFRSKAWRDIYDAALAYSGVESPVVNRIRAHTEDIYSIRELLDTRSSKLARDFHQYRERVRQLEQSKQQAQFDLNVAKLQQTPAEAERYAYARQTMMHTKKALHEEKKKLLDWLSDPQVLADKKYVNDIYRDFVRRREALYNYLERGQ